MSLARAAAPCLVLLLTLAVPRPALPQGAELEQVCEFVQRGELDRAAERIDAYVRMHPRDPRGRFLRGVVLAELNRIEDAITVYTELTQDYPELPEPYNNLAALHALQGRYDTARAHLEKAVNAQPGYATAHENLGDIYVKLAALSYGKAVELDRTRASALHKLRTVNELVPPAVPAGTP
jgi:Flp pilus assembly protein TadD